MRQLVLVLAFAGACLGQGIDPKTDIGIEQRLGESLPLDARFVDELDNDVKLGDYFGKRPVLLALVYYECPQLCTLVLNGMVGALKAVSLDPGVDFDIVVISIDPGETSYLARRKKRNYLASYGRKGTDAGWHFLSGEQAPITAVAEAVGYHYRYDEERDEYAHAAGLMVATPDGRMSRYYYGIEFSPRDLRLGLVEASDGEIGSVTDVILLLCFHYDPTTGKYGLVIQNVLRIAGGLTVLLLAAFIVRSVRRDRRAAAGPVEATP